MSEGATPQTVRLPRKNEYQIKFSMDGYRTQSIALTKSLNGWVWGNFLLGWIVGFVIDFISGSAYKLEPTIMRVSLETAFLENGEEALFAIVRLLDENENVLEEHKAEMEPVSSDTALQAAN